MKLRLQILFLSVGVICLTNSYSQTSLPKNLSEAILYFQNYWTKKELDKYKHKLENIAVSELHLGTGMWIRNNWVRGKRDTELTN